MWTINVRSFGRRSKWKTRQRPRRIHSWKTRLDSKTETCENLRRITSLSRNRLADTLYVLRAIRFAIDIDRNVYLRLGILLYLHTHTVTDVYRYTHTYIHYIYTHTHTHTLDEYKEKDGRRRTIIYDSGKVFS